MSARSRPSPAERSRISSPWTPASDLHSPSQRLALRIVRALLELPHRNHHSGSHVTYAMYLDRVDLSWFIGVIDEPMESNFDKAVQRPWPPR